MITYRFKQPIEPLYNPLTLEKGKGTRFHKSLSNAHLPNGLAALKELREGTLDTKHVYKHILINRDILEVAYNKISKNKGANTPGTDTLTLDGVSRKVLDRISLELKNHSYEFKPARREYIPKANGKLRPLGIPSPRDKIVQQAMVLILEAVWEKLFLNSSHGFRPNRGCHTALKQVERWTGIDWFIEGDIKSYFDTIDHHILANLIKEKIHDQPFLELYWKAVRAGYVEMKNDKKIDSTLGTPQGSIISPILSNIYLHELDCELKHMIEESQTSGNPSKPFKPYLKLHSRVHTLYKRAARSKKNWSSEDAENLRQTLIQRAKLPAVIKGPGYRIHYVRYADDFLVGLKAKRAKAFEIRQAIDVFLRNKLNLSLNLEKTKLTDAKRKKSKALFLGTEIYRNVSRTNNQKFVMKYNPKLKRRFLSRISCGKLSLLMPVERIVKKLSNQRMCRVDDWKQGKVVPTAKTAWMNLPLAGIIMKYNSVLLGYRNFYSFAANRNRMQLIQFIIQHSCAKTIGRKMRIKTRSKVFKTYGRYLKVPGETKPLSLKLLKSHKKTGRFLINPPDPLDVVYHSLRSKSLLNKSCVICNSAENIEIHHIKRLRGQIKGNMIETMRALNRKQIPVCQACHRNIHKGIYDGKSLKKLSPTPKK
jgi:nicotine oxidoreductase